MTNPPTINAESELVARLRTEVEIWKCSYGGAGYPHLIATLTEAAATIERLHSPHETLFDAIKHGDEVHRAWLREAIENHFGGKPVPPPRAANPSAHDQGRQEGIEMAAKACEALGDKIMKRAEKEHRHENYDEYEHLECQAGVTGLCATAVRKLKKLRALSVKPDEAP